MPHALTKVLIHAIWSTKNRKNLITPDLEPILYKKISEQFLALDCPLKIINGVENHVHCLFWLNAQKPLSDVIKQVKGSSSYYVNHEDLISDKFSWQTGFAAYSVNASKYDDLYRYIQDQKAHHYKKTFTEEYEEVMKELGVTDEMKLRNG